MWRPSRSNRQFSLERISSKISDAIHALLLEKSHLQRRELSFNDLKQRGLRLLPTTLGASFSPDVITKKPRLPSLSSFCHHDSVFRAHRWKRLSKTGQSHSCSMHFYAHTLSSVHLNDHSTLTEFLDWRHLSLGLPSFHRRCTFFHLHSQPFELLTPIESTPSLLKIIRPSSWSRSQLTEILHWRQSTYHF